MGRIILAHLPVEDVRHIFESSCKGSELARSFARFEDLLRRIQDDKKIGTAWGDAFPEPGVSSAAAHIFDHAGRVVASVNIMGPSAAFDAEPSRGQDIRSVLSQAAFSISEKLGYRNVYHRVGLDAAALT